MKTLFTAYWEFTKYLEKKVKDYGINYGNPKIILYLMENEGCRQMDIARRCYVETATLSTVLSKMEENGLIVRKHPEGDRRSYAIYPTEKGREVFENVKKQLDTATEIALSGFSETDIDRLKEYLRIVTDNMRGNNSLESIANKEHQQI
ncbi:MAG: MarR family transcriptional regulator [Lachnospiraceae bacterium]|nr:MarR family transcriptional regulator [Lachnospiraceae bacterium]